MEDRAHTAGYRPIMPRTSDAPPPPHQQTQTGSGLVRSAVACESCRERKTKCNSGRPTCTACASIGQVCAYRDGPSEGWKLGTLKRKYKELELQAAGLRESQTALQKLFQALQTRSEGDADAIFRKIRSGLDVESILRHLHDGDLLLQLRVAPETTYRFEFPLRSEMPSSLQTPANPYLRSLMYEAALSIPNAANSSKTSPAPFADDRYAPQYLKPYLAATLVEPRLDAVLPSKWTLVSRDDDLMRDLLRSYFLNEYQWLPCFHKDDFLDDMISGSKRYCSSLLVNTVLAFACHCYRPFLDRSEYWNPQTLGYRFLAEAKRLWELELGAKKLLPTLQAALLLNILFNMYVLDKVGRQYIIQAVAIAHELDLFVPSEQNKTNSGRNSRDFTRWCLYFWASIQDYQFSKSPVINHHAGPALPDPDKHCYWYGEFWIRYPLDDTLRPVNFGHVFKAKCELSTVINRLSDHLYNTANRKSTHTAAGLIGELAAWSSSLPPSMLPRNVVFPSQMKVHLLYHEAMIQLCEIIQYETEPANTDPPQQDITSLSAHSRVCFETIMRLYYLRHGFEGADSYLTHDLAVLAFIAQANLKALPQNTPDPIFPATNDSTPTTSRTISRPLSDLDDIRATLFLAAKGLYKQGNSYQLPLILLHVVRSMRPEDADMMHRFEDIRPEGKKVSGLRAEHAWSQYPVYIADAEGRLGKEILGDMVAKLKLKLGDGVDGVDGVEGGGG